MVPTLRGSKGEKGPRQKLVMLLAARRKSRNTEDACADICRVARECVSGPACLFGCIISHVCVCPLSKAGKRDQSSLLFVGFLHGGLRATNNRREKGSVAQRDWLACL